MNTEMKIKSRAAKSKKSKIYDFPRRLFGQFGYDESGGTFFIYNPELANKYFDYSGADSNEKYNDVPSFEDHHCRETFADDWNKVTKNNKFLVGFKGVENILVVKNFFSKIESKLKLSRAEKTKIIETNIKKVILLKVSRWWRANTTRRSLFTLLLRMSAIYFSQNQKDKKSFWDNFKIAVGNYNLAADVKNSIYHFLNGNTVPTFKKFRRVFHGSPGFVSHFRNIDGKKKFLEKSLIREK